MNEETDVHVFVWRAMPVIQCAGRIFHSYLKETKKNQQSILKNSSLVKLTSQFRQVSRPCNKITPLKWEVSLIRLELLYIHVHKHAYAWNSIKDYVVFHSFNIR